MSRSRLLLIAAACLPALLVAAAAWGLMLARAGLQDPFDAERARYVGSETCMSCHGDRHESWYSTYHRTMTQRADAESVQGRFDGRNLDYWGWRVRPVREGDRFFFEYRDPDDDALLSRLEIQRTVGSHRYQQYLARLPDEGTFVRLHYLWHNDDERWIHMNAAFLGPDDMPFDQHAAIWNQNCIFCHNTGPVPNISNYEALQARAGRGEAVDVGRDTRFDSSVAELGIACESCHGPGGTHAARADAFATRTAMRLWPGRDNSIVNPVRLGHERGSQVCGQCHAQRTPAEPERIVEWMRDGPSYRPGDDLHEHVAPIWRDTNAPVDGREDLFRARFWDDGTPRLTAYEYQGLLQSACHDEGELSCMDCHSMHAGDPAGQLTDRNRGNAPCLRCHQALRDETALAGHTRHPADSPASVCYECHMPRIVYGVMDIHRSHRIEVPDAARDAANGRPNACLNCHLDAGAEWAAERLGEWPGAAPAGATARSDELDAGIAQLAAVVAGDPVQKAVAAWHASYRRGAGSASQRAWMLPYLMLAMEDVYPAVRRFARRSAMRIVSEWSADWQAGALQDALEAWDFMASAEDRGPGLMRIRTAWEAIDKRRWPEPPPAARLTHDWALPEALRQELVRLGRRSDKQIAIGE
ncbi:MAG: hypothetical protein GVY32_08725 [Gammaproteobacteria bacterium]|jgi:hypothetical protein|nr:hypothetical protein [Gammaproteobacteria bacterium]